MPILDSMSKIVTTIVGITAIITFILANGGYAWLQREIPPVLQIPTTTPLLNVTTSTSSSSVITPPPPQSYGATVQARDPVGWLSVPITMDSVSTSFSTPHTFNLTGTHIFTVPGNESRGYMFTSWDTGQTSTTIRVSSGGTFTAQYEQKLVVVINPCPLPIVR